MAKSNNKGILSTIIFMVLIGVIIVLAYIKINTKDDSAKLEPAVVMSEVEQLLAKDLANNYPATSRETLKLYCRITKCLFSEELNADQIEGLIDMLRYIYSDEMLELNSKEDMVTGLLADMETYHNSSMSIYSYTVDASSKIEHINDSKGSRDIIRMYFTIKNKTSFERSYEEFVMCKDDRGYWKILGWRNIATADVTTEE